MRRVLRLASVAGLFVSASGCGSSPSSPTPRVPEANIVIVRENLELVDFNRESGWTVQGQARNTGPGCAVEVAGTLTFVVPPNDRVLATVNFQLEPGRQIMADERFTYRGCCLSAEDGSFSGTYNATFRWRSVLCS